MDRKTFEQASGLVKSIKYHEAKLAALRQMRLRVNGGRALELRVDSTGNDETYLDQEATEIVLAALEAYHRAEIETNEILLSHL